MFRRVFEFVRTFKPLKPENQRQRFVTKIDGAPKFHRGEERNEIELMEYRKTTLSNVQTTFIYRMHHSEIGRV